MTGLSPFVWALLASFCWGFAPLIEKIGLRGNVDPALGVLVRTSGVLLGAICFLPFLSRIPGRFTDLSSRNWIFLALGGIVASVVGQLCFYRALKFGEVSRVAPIGASYPMLAFILGTVFLGESVTVSKVGGIALVMTGVYLLR